MFSWFIGGYVRQLNDGRTLTMEKAMKGIDQDTQVSSFSSHKLFSALLLIRLDFRQKLQHSRKDGKQYTPSLQLSCTVQILPLQKPM